MREQLQKLDIERADLAGKVETARDNWLKTQDTRQEAKLERAYEDLKKEFELLNMMRRDLQNKLPSSGEHIVQTAFAKLSMVGVRACILKSKDFCIPKTFSKWKQRGGLLSQRHDPQLRFPAQVSTWRDLSLQLRLHRPYMWLVLPHPQCRLEVQGNSLPICVLAAEIAACPGRIGRWHAQCMQAVLRLPSCQTDSNQTSKCCGDGCLSTCMAATLASIGRII